MITPLAWVNDSPISAFMSLLNHGNVFTVDSMFLTSFRSYLHRNVMKHTEDFIQDYFGSPFSRILYRLHVCEIVLITLHNSDYTGCNGNHLGLAVLHKISATFSSL